MAFVLSPEIGTTAMNQPIIIASTILAVAIVAAAWLLKPIPPICFKTFDVTTPGATTDLNSGIIDQCSGRVWIIDTDMIGWGLTFDAVTQRAKDKK